MAWITAPFPEVFVSEALLHHRPAAAPRRHVMNRVREPSTFERRRDEVELGA